MDIPVVSRNNRHENKLHDIETEIEGEESTDSDVEAISEFEIFHCGRACCGGGRRWCSAGLRWRTTEETVASASGSSRGGASGKTGMAWGGQEGGDEEVGGGGDQKGGREEVYEDEDERDAEDGGE